MHHFYLEHIQERLHILADRLQGSKKLFHLGYIGLQFSPSLSNTMNRVASLFHLSSLLNHVCLTGPVEVRLIEKHAMPEGEQGVF